MLCLPANQSLLNKSSAPPPLPSTGLDHFQHSFQRIHGYVSSGICLFGIASNAANIVVLTRSPLTQSPTNWLLTYLAVADLVTMLIYLPALTYFYLVKVSGTGNVILPTMHTDSYAWVAYQKMMASGTVWIHSSAVWLTVALAVFRFLCIYWPVRGPALCSTAGVSRTAVAIVLCCLAATLPNFVVTRVTSCLLVAVVTSSQNNSAATSSLRLNYNSGLTKNSPQRVFHLIIDNMKYPITSQLNFWMQALLFKLLPSLLLTALTLALILSMRKASQRHSNLMHRPQMSQHAATSMSSPSSSSAVSSQKTRRAKSREQRTTIMLLAVVILFLITEAPQGLLILLSYFRENFYQDVYEKLGDFIDFLTLLNESANFVLYTTMSKQFRTTFSALFCRCCRFLLPPSSTMGTHVTSHQRLRQEKTPTHHPRPLQHRNSRSWRHDCRDDAAKPKLQQLCDSDKEVLTANSIRHKKSHPDHRYPRPSMGNRIRQVLAKDRSPSDCQGPRSGMELDVTPSKTPLLQNQKEFLLTNSPNRQQCQM